MTHPVVYVALQQFCEEDGTPREILLEAGCSIQQNRLGRRLQREELCKALQGADAVVAGLEPYDADLLAQLPRLRCISRCGVGTEFIDLEVAGQRKIAVLTTGEEAVEPVAQMTVALILALARHLGLYVKQARQGQWRKYTGNLLSEWTIGLVGFGRIGRAVARHLQSWGPRILVADPFIDAASLPPGVSLCDLSCLLMESDLVSLHVARRPEEGILIGRKELALMKPGSRLVNTARGYLVEEAALCEALEAGHLSGAALDVFETEPYRGRLMQLPQVVCTPHVASLTRASRKAMELKCAKNLVEFFKSV